MTAPEPLTEHHNTIEFECGIDSLNNWLKKRALKNHGSGASRTFAVCRGNREVGFYALASGSVERLTSPKPVARNMPDPIPVIILGRLAVDLSTQGQKLGAALLKDALLRSLAISKQVDIRAVLVHALSEDAKRFYQHFGFIVSPISDRILLLPIRHIEMGVG